MLLKSALVVLVLIAGVLTYAATKPDAMHIERSTGISAPAAAIVPLISDFRNWRSWSPYEKLDPDLKRTYSGAPSGKGAVYEWEGNGDAGQGRMEITDISPSQVTIKLDFIKPFETHNVATFSLTPQGDATGVTWAMDGPSPYMAKVMGVFVDMDKLIGKDFEAGLANMKALAETR